MLSVISIFMMRASRVLATYMTAQLTIVATSSRPRRAAAISPLQAGRAPAERREHEPNDLR